VASAAPAKPNPLTEKLGPLPFWTWALLGLALGWYAIRRYHNSTSSAPLSSLQAPSTTPASPFDDSGGGGGGSASEPNSLPVIPVGVDPTIAQVQQQDTTSPESPQAITQTTYAPTYAPSAATLAAGGVPQSGVYTVPTPTGSSSAPIPTSTGHGPQLTG
jgi:hypothetical protein